MASRRKETGDARPNAKRRRSLRVRLFTVQDGCCPWCAGPLDGPTDGELDRIVPGKYGGRYVLDNLVLACSPCNQSHGRLVRTDSAPERTHP